MAAPEDVVRDGAEEERRQRLGRRPKEGAHALGAAPEQRHHDVEPGRVERRVLRRDRERGEDQVGHGRQRAVREDRRDEENDGAGGGDRADDDAAVQVAAM